MRWSLATALLFLLPGLFLVAYVWLADAPTGAIVPHLLVVATFAAGLAGMRLVLSHLPLSSDMHRLLSACLICGILLLLACLYAGSLIGLKSWGRVATFNLLSTYVNQAPDLIRTLGYSPALVFAVLAVVPLVGVAGAYRFLVRHDWVPAFRSSVSTLGSIVVAVALLLIFGVALNGLEDRGWGREGEPLSLSLFPWQGDRDMQSHRIDVFRSKQLQRDDELARAAYVPSAAGSRSNVILIVADALRANRLSLFGYERKTTPYLEGLRDKGVMRLAGSALAVCNESACGLQALASSRYLDGHSEAPLTLHEVLKKHGYRVHLVLSGDHKNFYGLDRIYGPIDSYSDGSFQKDRYVNDDRLVFDRLSGFSRWDGTPTMFQFHLMSTHALGERFAETPAYGPGSNYTGNRWTPAEERLRLAANFYDRGVLQLDSVISTLLAQLKERGYLEDALVVITGDHGEMLGERGVFSHAHSVWEEALRVPFIVLAFGRADPGPLKAGPALSQIDIAPTVLHMLGMPQPVNWEGHALQARSERQYVHFQQSQSIGLLDTTSPDQLYKYWVDTRAGREYTFNLTTDPGETTNVTDTVSSAVRQRWRAELLSRSGALPRELQDKLREPVVSH